MEALSTHLGRPLSLIAETDLNDPRLITPREAGGYGLHAQWDDDVHHALHAAADRRAAGLLRRLRLAGVPGRRADRRRSSTTAPGPASAAAPRPARSTGSARPATGSWPTCRTTTRSATGPPATGSPPRCRPGLLRVGAALLLTAPFTPMLFMGEEWAASTPWQFFTSHPEPELATAVAQGRRAEFADARLGRRRRARPAGPGRRSRGPGWTGPSWTSPSTARLSTCTGG